MSPLPDPISSFRRRAVFGFLLVACCASFSTLASQTQVRWATSVISFSSQYSSPDYGAVQTLGEPNVFPGYGDERKAWSPRTEDGQREWLELGFNDPIAAAAVAIYEHWTGVAQWPLHRRGDGGVAVD